MVIYNINNLWWIDADDSTSFPCGLAHHMGMYDIDMAWGKNWWQGCSFCAFDNLRMNKQ